MEESQTIALKEWAIAIKALEAGEQIVILRKGGIIEETRDFRLESNAFLLYPTYEHQKKELLKSAYQPQLDQILKESNPQATSVKITSYAEVTADIEVNNQEELNRLFPMHIWTEHFAEDRLHWKRTKPLHVLILRVYTLEDPLEIPVMAEYNGCKSWIRLHTELPEAISLKPVLSETEFTLQSEQIKYLLSE
jgi:hypothetical protein